ncbi:hypothetical protein FUAX_20900 [Fulvitalea axinellae]|uniref:Uncharacterized protein n=1 Tax=Fulvitalea axinellae TaxID=1182444 RepID=A0AAU9CHZ7_9BACT|nr:hypothetical protein FUAX_20900 [Fulvitalea axinellae]
MRALSKISAIFFLGILCLLLMHTLVPHVHHDHKDFYSATVNAETHHKRTDHHQKKSTLADFLSDFIEKHAHGFDTDTYKGHKVLQDLWNGPEYSPVAVFCFLFEITFPKESIAPQEPRHEVPISPKRFTLAWSHRGPPSFFTFSV